MFFECWVFRSSLCYLLVSAKKCFTLNYSEDLKSSRALSFTVGLPNFIPNWKLGQFASQPLFDHSEPGWVWISDPHCSCKLKPTKRLVSVGYLFCASYIESMLQLIYVLVVMMGYNIDTFFINGVTQVGGGYVILWW